MVLYVSGVHGGGIRRVGRFTFSFSERPNVSEYQWVPNPNDPNSFVQAPSNERREDKAK
jgi:hypothetical protein